MTGIRWIIDSRSFLKMTENRWIDRIAVVFCDRWIATVGFDPRWCFATVGLRPLDLTHLVHRRVEIFFDQKFRLEKVLKGSIHRRPLGPVPERIFFCDRWNLVFLKMTENRWIDRIAVVFRLDSRMLFPFRNSSLESIYGKGGERPSVEPSVNRLSPLKSPPRPV